MSTIENNKLIAKFMNHYENMGNIGLQYHSDWNWLMEVVEKLESMEIEVRMNSHFNTTLKYTLYQTQICYDLKHKNCESTHLYLSYNDAYKNRKDSIYNAVVEFIKWYKTKNLKTHESNIF
jgi:hypothetical protein